MLLLGPLLGGYALVKLIRWTPDRWPQLACAAVLALALPAPLISRVSAYTGEGNEARLTTAEASSAGFVTLANGWSVRNPLAGFGNRQGLRLWLLAAGIIAALLSVRRAAAARATAVVLAAATAFYFPPLCTLLLRVAGSNWILARLEAILFVSFAVLVPATIAFWIEPKTRFAWVRALLSVGAFAVASPYLGAHAWKRWTDFASAASRPAEARQSRLTGLRAMRQFFSAHIPAGQTILIDESLGGLLVMLCDCHIVSPMAATGGVPDLKERWEDNVRMLSDRTSWAERRALLRKHGIRYYVPVGPLEWPRQYAAKAWTLDEPRVLVIELKGD